MNVRLHLKASQPDVATRPLKGTISIVHDKHGNLYFKEIVITDPESSSIGISLDGWQITTAKNHKVVLKLQHCYVPIDLGSGKTSIPRGVKIDAVEMSK